MALIPAKNKNTVCKLEFKFKLCDTKDIHLNLFVLHLVLYCDFVCLHLLNELGQ